jgi:MFS family permease
MINNLRTDLRLSTAEGTANNVMVGVGETYLPAFVLALTGSQLACGLVSTLPLVVGALMQLASPWMLAKCGSYRRWVALCAAVQAATFVPLVIAALYGRMNAATVFALVAVYWATGLGSSGPWNAWIETLVPARVRTRYFARRTRINQWGIVVGFLAGGIALQAAERWNIPLAVFAALFFMAAASRIVSVGLLTMHREPHPPCRTSVMPLASILRSLSKGENGRLLLYLMAAQAAVQIASPYFNPFMLSELHFSYTIYAIVVCTATVAKIYFLPTVGRIVGRVGVRRVFWTSAAASVFLPALWLVSNNWIFLVGVQIYSGMAWCAFDLATLLLFIETIPRQKRVDVLAFFNLANSVAMAGGSLLGAGILAALGAGRGAYLGLFAISTIARGLAIVLLVRRPARSVVREIGRVTAPQFVTRSLPRRGRLSDEAQSEPETAAIGRM